MKRESAIFHDLANLLRHDIGSIIISKVVEIMMMYELEEIKSFIKPTYLTLDPLKK